MGSFLKLLTFRKDDVGGRSPYCRLRGRFQVVVNPISHSGTVSVGRKGRETAPNSSTFLPHESRACRGTQTSRVHTVYAVK